MWYQNVSEQTLLLLDNAFDQRRAFFPEDVNDVSMYMYWPAQVKNALKILLECWGLLCGVTYSESQFHQHAYCTVARTGLHKMRHAYECHAKSGTLTPWHIHRKSIKIKIEREREWEREREREGEGERGREGEREREWGGRGLPVELSIVWSKDGPVWNDVVEPLFLVQSKSSVLSCVKPSNPDWKVTLVKPHANKAERKHTAVHNQRTVFSFAPPSFYFPAWWLKTRLLFLSLSH